MNYKYITEDNLENKQNYMYSEYCGQEFLDAYVSTRKNIIEKEQIFERVDHNTYQELSIIKEKLIKNDNIERLLKQQIDAYVKTFEVRKRLYAGYDSTWRPVVNNYRIYYNYLLLCEVLLLVWHKTKCTKYINCLLKITDSLISIISEMNETEEYRLINILKEELSIFEEIKEVMCSDT